MAGPVRKIAARLRPAPRVRRCPSCGREEARRICCGGLTGYLEVCVACGHVARW